MKINDLVYQKRKELGEDQATFGKRFGISHAAISDIERAVTTSLSFEMIEFLFRDHIPQAQKSIEDQVYDAIVSAFQFDENGNLLVNSITNRSY